VIDQVPMSAVALSGQSRRIVGCLLLEVNQKSE
jgi:hypothetical protein